MHRVLPRGPLKLVGFNNLTKAMSFNLYDFCIARNESERRSYMAYIAQRYSARKVTEVLRGICRIIDANVLAVSDQDYEPWGASSMVLMSDIKGSGADQVVSAARLSEAAAGERFGGVAMHVDKSHVCAHTYPDFHGGGTICSFRIDIDISTCGDISPLNALNFMLRNFDADVVVMDYSVRGFTRDADGRRVYMDHALRSIQEFIDPALLADYYCVDLALQSEHIWQTKMLRQRLDVQSYFRDPVDPDDADVQEYMEQVKREMRCVLHLWPE